VANTIQFGDFEEFEGFDPKAGPHCIACEAMLTDAVDETLGEIDRAWFDRHIDSCVRCSEKLADAQRGSAWLEMLRSPRPEPGPEMMARILAQTTGAENSIPGSFEAQGSPAWAGVSPFLPPVPEMAVPASRNVLPFRPAVRGGMRTFGRILLEPRLAMTAAMAFFSVALTLNLTGVRLNQVHASDLKPSNLRRDYFQASSHAVRYYDNLRVVHVMESRVEDLKQAAVDTEQDTQQRQEPQEPKTPAGPETPSNPEPKPESKPDGTSRRENPGQKPRVLLAGENVWAKQPAALVNQQNVEQQNVAGGRA
jgi:hypothetical protein